jgi:2-polyprenyl-6-methoxyphenol hydroxylase-like FAD-dependent oxidoreductase
MGRKRAVIIGGSVGGLFAALLLRAAGWDAAVFERSGGALADRGAGLGTGPQLFEVMRRVGIAPDPSVGVSVHSRICFDRDGAILHEVPVESRNSAWDRIYRQLRAALPDECYRAGQRLVRVEQDEASATAVFADGRRETGDLLVAADGIHSTVRAQLMPEVQPRYAGYLAWRGVIEESELTAEEHALLFGRMAFSLPEGELLLALGIPGRDQDLRPGHRRYYWVWFHPADAAATLPALCTDATGRCHGTSIPPHLVRAEAVGELRDAAAALLAPPLAAVVRRTAQPYPHGVFDVEASRLVNGRVALLGDAAFVARPHVGAGVTKAALDAVCLADALAGKGDLTAALARYDDERRAAGAAVIARARYLGAYLEAYAAGAATVERRPATVLAEYGVAGTIA